MKTLWHGTADIALAKRICGKNISHIHSHMAHVPTSIAMYAARHLGVSFSFTGHAVDIFPSRILLRKKISRALFVNCISHWHRNFYKNISPKEDEALPIVRCGVDTETVSMVPREHGETLHLLGLGRLVEKKGFDILIKAVGRIAQRGNAHLSLTIAGSGPEEENLKKTISNQPDSAHIKLLGEVKNEKALALMEETDIFVLPCRVSSTGDKDGIPVVLMEAMAKGRCVITGNLITIRELVSDQVNGFLIENEDVDSLVIILEKLAVNHKLIDTVGAEARKTIEKEFDLKLNATRIIKTFQAHSLLR